MKTFVSPPTETPWKADPAQLAEAMGAHFERIAIRPGGERSQAHALEWTWSTPYGPVEGSLDVACTGVVLDGDIRPCAEFAIWLRSFAPQNQELVFYDEAYSAVVPLENETSTEELISRLAG
jgi:hypothetical protein